MTELTQKQYDDLKNRVNLLIAGLKNMIDENNDIRYKLKDIDDDLDNLDDKNDVLQKALLQTYDILDGKEPRDINAPEP